jgi:hypothetical protein
MMAEHGLDMFIPPGTVTYPNAGTAIDLVWGNANAQQAVVKCQMSDKCDHNSDHLAIETTLDLKQRTSTCTEMPLNYAKTDWDALERKLPKYLPQIINPESVTMDTLDQFANNLTNAITKAIYETTPRKKLCPFSKSWWNEKLTKLRKDSNSLRNSFRRYGNEGKRLQWRAKAKEYEKEIKMCHRGVWSDYGLRR